MKNLAIALGGYVVFSFLFNHVAIVEKQGHCDAFCPTHIQSK
jgi:hypothetical protein